jgi:hypothetical protein
MAAAAELSIHRFIMIAKTVPTDVPMPEFRMLTESSGFDLAVPTAAFIQRHVRSSAYLLTR